MPGPFTSVHIISWIAPTLDEFGQPLTDLAGYIVYAGNTTPTVYFPIGAGSFDVGNVTSYAYTVTSSGPWFFAVTAYDTAVPFNESDPSTELARNYLMLGNF